MEPDNRWSDMQRLEGWVGESRVNLIRLAAILLFYGHHLINVMFFPETLELPVNYHALVTLLVLSWALVVVLLHLCLSRRWNPPFLKYAVTLWDVVFITLILLMGQDTRSMLPVLFFLVILAAVLRLSLRLVYVATLATIAAYLFYLGHFKYWQQLPEERLLDRPQQIIVILALGAAGFLAGQVVRQAQRLVQGYPVIVVEGKERVS
jgi:hypothetical protein